MGLPWASHRLQERMIDGNMQLNTITCNAMIRACDQAGQWQRALDVSLDEHMKQSLVFS